MSELLSEHHDDHDETEPTCCSHTTKSIQWPPVSNIIVWLDCYTSLVSVLCSAHPDKFSQFTRQMQTASWGEPDDFEVLMAVQTTIDLTSCMNSSYCSWILPVSVQA